MDYTVIILGIIIVFLIYYLYVNYLGAEKPITKKADLNASQPNVTAINNPANLNYSYGLWLYVNSWNNNSDKFIFSRSNNIQLYLDKTIPTLKCNINTTQGNETILITDNFPLQKWVYIIVSVDGKIIDCYINGKLIKSQKIKNEPSQPSDASTAPIVFGRFDATLANLMRTTTPMDPQTAWNNYINNSMSTTTSTGSYAANISLVKDSIQISNIKLF
jgi:hypothetical protein